MKTKKMTIAIILSLLILIISQVLAQMIASIVLVFGAPEFVCNVVAGVLYILFAYWFCCLLCKKYLKEDRIHYNIPNSKISLKWLIVAFALPLSVTAIYLLFVDGTYIINETDMLSKLSIVTAGVFFTGLGSGIVEELVFRGIMMTVIEKRFNKGIAIIVPSLLFGVLHIVGRNYNLLSCLLVILAGTVVGVMFSLIASETKSIWNSAVVHAVWNTVIIGGILTIGTKFDEYSLCSYVLSSQKFALTGGEFGIESSVIGVIAYSLICLFIIWEAGKKNNGNRE